jgi:hypothetical protein
MASLTYPPLPDATQIRLLQINDGEFNDLVVCQMAACSRAEANYIAISHMWGEPNELTTILVNGSEVTVRRNCAHALSQTREHACRYRDQTLVGNFWIDALCIDQEDASEKSVQVAMMADTFRDAREVWACVGTFAQLAKPDGVFETTAWHLDKSLRRDFLGSKLLGCTQCSRGEAARCKTHLAWE